jgi:hypothetical protein
MTINAPDWLCSIFVECGSKLAGRAGGDRRELHAQIRRGFFQRSHRIASPKLTCMIRVALASKAAAAIGRPRTNIKAQHKIV